MRAESVRSPRNTSHALNGDATAPTSFRTCSTRSKSSSRVLNASEPPCTSLCPPMYFVVECSTTSAPNSIGRCSTGVANVESTSNIAPPACATSASAARSTTFISGFDGDSAQITRVSGRIAARTAPASSIATTSHVRFHWLKKSSARARYP